MVANGCLLDEAFGEIKTHKEKKKRKKTPSPPALEGGSMQRAGVDFDSSYTSMAPEIDGFVEEEELFYEIEKPVKKTEKRMMEKIEHLKREEYDDDDKNKEYRRLLNNKDYQDYLNYQRNRANYINNIQTVEGFSNINDNFNDVLLFGLLGIFFLIFTDYIYKLGKKSY
jgi:hypothetical protein|tara:strand:+ start:507 stop:1013 length:507 start_codon:yes stop_codon:yes gene_type:complete